MPLPSALSVRDTLGHPTDTTGRHRLYLMDGFRLLRDDEPLEVAAGGQRLVALLGLAGPRNRSVAAGTLWPDVTEEHAHGCLRTALWRMQRLCPGLILVHGRQLRLDPTLTLDTERFAARALDVIDGPDGPDGTDGTHGGAEVAEELLNRDALSVGELLPGWYDDWVIFERERLRQLRMHALEMLSARLVRHRRYGVALEVALDAVRIEPLRESAHRAVICVHLGEGNVGEARRHYAMLRDLLADELAVEPTPELTSLVSAAGARR